jgi:hypothetical protein
MVTIIREKADKLGYYAESEYEKPGKMEFGQKRHPSRRIKIYFFEC